MSFLAAFENVGAGVLAIIYLIIGVIVVSLTIAWIVFPFIVISKFNELLKVARELANDFEDARNRLKTVAENLEAYFFASMHTATENDSSSKRMIC